MIQRRAKATGIETKIGNHTFRATRITAYLKNSGKLEVAQHIANHESPRTTKLYDRRQDHTDRSVTFVFTFLFALKAADRMETTVHQIIAFVASLDNVLELEQRAKKQSAGDCRRA